MNDKKSYDSFAEEVWETLSRIDCTTHMDYIEATAKRPQIGYVAWHKAWMLVKRNFPGSTYAHREDLWHPDETVEVEVDVQISTGDGNELVFTNARLAVMDMWFNPITNPTARQINDGRQRALVKALAFAGLGLNMWGDDNVPVGTLADPISYDQLEILTDLIAKTETNENTFLRWCEAESLDLLPVEQYSAALGLLQTKAQRMAAAKKATKKKAVKK